MNGCTLITQERNEHLTREGWTAEHDRHHVAGEMIVAAMAYLQAALNRNTFHGIRYDEPADDWPWAGEWFKPTVDEVGNLVKAGALIAAEIDRLLGTAP